MKNKKNTVLITLTIMITLVSIVLAIMLVNSNNQLSKTHKELESVKEEKDRAVMVKDKLSTYVSNVDHDLFLEANDFVWGRSSFRQNSNHNQRTKKANVWHAGYGT